MTSFPRSHSLIGRRRRLIRGACASTIAALLWSATGSTAAAHPISLIEAPTVSAAFSGLSVGSRGSDVKSLQQTLLNAGITVAGGADGIYGPATRRAVTDFQNARGLSASGEVDQATAAALATNAGGSNDSNGTPSGSELSVGAQGPEVTALQNQLTAGGAYVAGGADGVFGAATKRAVTQYQRWNGLEPTGTVNLATAKRLGVSSASATPPAATLAATPAPTTSANPYVGLANGARGQLVKDLQTALQATGLVVRGGVDGVFGPATESALKIFQRVNALTQSGVVSERGATLLKLGTGSATAPPAQSEVAPTPVASSNGTYVGLKVGASGPLVKELQVSLQRLGLTVRGGADGSFGPATKSALIAFQSVNGIAQTGVVTEKGARILNLGSGNVGTVGIVNPNSGVTPVQLERFPAQGLCFFGDTWGAARGGGRKHEGVDIIANEGNLLYAVVDGEISKRYWDQPGALSGNGLRVAQPNGTYFTYLHMSSFAPGIELGTKVKAGDVIGFVGNTGSSATPHLHFEIHPGGGSAVNPYPYVKAIDGCSDTTLQYQASFN